MKRRMSIPSSIDTRDRPNLGMDGSPYSSIHAEGEIDWRPLPSPAIGSASSLYPGRTTRDAFGSSEDVQSRRVYAAPHSPAFWTEPQSSPASSPRAALDSPYRNDDDKYRQNPERSPRDTAPSYFDGDIAPQYAREAVVDNPSNRVQYNQPLLSIRRSRRGGFRLPRAIHPLVLVPALFCGALLMFLVGPPNNASRTFRRNPDWTPINGQSLDSNSSECQLHENGHLYVLESAVTRGLQEHPIDCLIRNATQAWQEKINKQSTNLRQAVREYKRRYNRNPPKGFDIWFEFAQRHHVALLDEYDSISDSIEPFFSLSPELLQERLQSATKFDFTFTLAVRNGQTSIRGNQSNHGRAKDQRDLLEGFAQWLPDMDIVMSVHDGPAVLLDQVLRSKHRSLAKSGQIIDRVTADTPDDDAALSGFALACHEDSRLRRHQMSLEGDAYTGKAMSFVSDHVRTMDMCANPEWQPLHGFTGWHGVRPVTLFPIFSFSKTTMHSDILAVPLEQIRVEVAVDDPAFHDKPINKVMWRGSPTGVWFDRLSSWRTSQRQRLINIMQHTTAKGAHKKRILQSLPKQEGPEIVETSLDHDQAVQRYFDFGYTGELVQCSREDGSCDALQRHITMEKPLDWMQQNKYKYALDVDGNAWSGRFHRLMASNAAVLKSTIFPEWYADRIQPWVHYIPIRIDYSDLFDIMAYFSGDLDGNNAHEAAAEKIALAGKEWAAKYWRWQDMQAYAFRLYLEYARVCSSDRSSMDFT